MKYTKLGIGLVAASLIAVCSAADRPSASEVETLAKTYYANLSAYDFAALRNTTTPRFEAIEHTGTRAMRMTRADFEKRLQGAQKSGAKLSFSLSEFNTHITSDAAYTSYVETAAGTGKKYYAGMVFIRDGDAWLADRLFTLPIPEQGEQAPAQGDQ